MSCNCIGIEKTFGEKNAKHKLKQYLKKGAGKETKTLINAFKNFNLKNKSLLDIGGGIGAIPIELAKQGVFGVTGVDASTHYLKIAKKEISKILSDVKFIEGDFVDLADEIPEHDIVTLDKVICCYAGMERLVSYSAKKAKKYYAIIIPREIFLIKLGLKLLNLIYLIIQNPMKVFAHKTDDVEKIIFENNFKNIFYSNTFAWQIRVYEK